MKHISMPFYNIPLCVKLTSKTPDIGGQYSIQQTVKTFGSVHGGRKHAFEKDGKYIIPRYKIIIPYNLFELNSFDESNFVGYIEINDSMNGGKSYKIDYCSAKRNPDGSFHHFSILVGGEENAS